MVIPFVLVDKRERCLSADSLVLFFIHFKDRSHVPCQTVPVGNQWNMASNSHPKEGGLIVIPFVLVDRRERCLSADSLVLFFIHFKDSAKSTKS